MNECFSNNNSINIKNGEGKMVPNLTYIYTKNVYKQVTKFNNKTVILAVVQLITCFSRRVSSRVTLARTTLSLNAKIRHNNKDLIQWTYFVTLCLIDIVCYLMSHYTYSLPTKPPEFRCIRSMSLNVNFSFKFPWTGALSIFSSIAFFWMWKLDQA